MWRRFLLITLLLTWYGTLIKLSIGPHMTSYISCLGELMFYNLFMSMHSTMFIHNIFACVCVYKNLPYLHATNVLDSSHNIGSYALFDNCYVWWYELFDCLMFKFCWDLQMSRLHVCLHSGTGMLALGLCYCVGGQSIRQVETIHVLIYVHS